MTAIDPMKIIELKTAWREEVRQRLQDNLPEGDATRIDQAISEAISDKIAESDGPTWEWRRMSDAYAPRDDLVYVVDGLITEASLTMFFGAPGCLKSMLVADMALCIAAGIPWLESLPDKLDFTPFYTTMSPIIWIDCDNGQRRTDERLEAIGKAYGIPDEAPVYYVSLPTPMINASDEGSMAQLAHDINLLGARVVVMDNLGTVKGSANENTDEMVPVMANLRRLAEETGAAIILIHHQRKLSGIASRDGDMIRGHSSIESSLDLGLKVDRESPDSPFVTVKGVKVRGADVKPFQAMFTYDWREGTHDMEKARFFGAQVKDDSNPRAVKDTIIEIVGDIPGVKKGDLASRVHEAHDSVAINTVRRYIDELVSAAKITEEIGARNAKTYGLPAGS